MRKFVVEYLVQDGEHEYHQYVLTQAENYAAAEKHISKILDAGGYKGDYREYEIENIQEVSDSVWKTLARFHSEL